MTDRHRGRVIKFFDRYGFIPPDAGGKAWFFHISDIAGDETPASGDVVTFTMGEDDRGRSKAVEVAPEG